MELKYLIKGIIIGFSIAAPVGPIGILCIRRSLTHGTLAGLLTGLGASTADAFYGCVAGFGLTLISGFLLDRALELHLAGGIFLCWMGWKTLQKAPCRDSGDTHRFNGFFKSYLSALFLTLTNPMTIMAFMAIFSGLGIAACAKNHAFAGILVAGVFTGSAAWWLLLTFGTARIGKQFSPLFMRRINQLSGIILILFGAWALSSSMF